MRSRRLCGIHTTPKSWCDLLRVSDTKGPCLRDTRHCDFMSSSRVPEPRLLHGLTSNSMVPSNAFTSSNPQFSHQHCPWPAPHLLHLKLCIATWRCKPLRSRTAPQATLVFSDTHGSRRPLRCDLRRSLKLLSTQEGWCLLPPTYTRTYHACPLRRQQSVGAEKPPQGRLCPKADSVSIGQSVL